MGLLREWHGGRPKAGLTWHKALADAALMLNETQGHSRARTKTGELVLIISSLPPELIFISGY